MLYIKMKGSKNGIEWHVGSGLNVDPTAVESVQADCDELDHILRHAKNLVHTNARVQSWFGDDAAWIVGNIIRYCDGSARVVSQGDRT